MKVIQIRKAVAKDLPILKEFEQGIISAERPFDPTLAPDPINYYDLGELIGSDNAEVLAAFAEDQLIGGGYIKIKEAKPYLDHEIYGYIGFLFVVPEWRGKGVVGEIMNQLISWADSKGIKEVRLEVYDENDSAVRAYEKVGFKKHMVEMRLKR